MLTACVLYTAYRWPLCVSLQVSFRMAVDDPERYQRASNFALDDVVREQALRAKIAAMNENASDAAAAPAQEEEVSSK